jgi:asparagine synthase (glutamine-hydrolysing)
MCGIAGLVDSRLAPTEASSILARMTATLRHRGPDGIGQELFTDGDTAVGLGQTRLAIIDCSAAGRQPLCNEDRSVWITFNGELYNFQDLRPELERKGHRFSSNTDTEVLVHLYEEEGQAFLERLNGMFGFALYDRRKQRLLLARDPIGIKPLYYHVGADGRLLFGSEIKALLVSGLVPRTVNRQAVHDYFTYLNVPCPDTIFEGIQQLPPGHALVGDLGAKTWRVERYWKLRRLEDVERAPEEELRERARELASKAVRRQLVSDVPLGLFLSGGVDSPIVAGLAREVSDVRSYTVVFRGDDLAFYNEQDNAAAVSRHLGTVHEELEVDIADPGAMLDLVGNFDQPFGNPTFYLQYLISRAARRHITVALSGTGGDELYAGYPRYKALRLARKLRWLPRPLLRLGRSGLGLMKDSYKAMTLRRAREFLDGLDPDPVRQFTNWTYFLNEDDKRKLLGKSGSLPSDRILREVLAASPVSEPMNRWLHTDVQTYLPDNLLEYSDKMSMAVGLETRVPLLDVDFVEFSLNVPWRYKLDGRRTKVLLRDTFASFFPPEVARAPKKGFNPPLGRWMLTTFDSYFDVERDPGARERWGDDAGVTWREGLLDRTYVDHLRTEFRARRYDYSHELFAVLIFDVWWRRYVSGEGTFPKPPF